MCFDFHSKLRNALIQYWSIPKWVLELTFELGCVLELTFQFLSVCVYSYLHACWFDVFKSNFPVKVLFGVSLIFLSCSLGTFKLYVQSLDLKDAKCEFPSPSICFQVSMLLWAFKYPSYHAYSNTSDESPSWIETKCYKLRCKLDNNLAAWLFLLWWMAIVFCLGHQLNLNICAYAPQTYFYILNVQNPDIYP